jgi:hypothetical protein
MIMISYKFLESGAVGLVSGLRWPTPVDDARGDWVAAKGRRKTSAVERRCEIVENLDV